MPRLRSYSQMVLVLECIGMKTNLRSIFGYVTIVCILLAIFRRLILLAFDDCAVDFWHCVCGPWYGDLYLLGLEGFWTFDGSVK